MKDVKARQSAKIREIGAALVAMGYRALDEQARALGLGRSTAWTILQANHKNSGLSATVIIRMLAAPSFLHSSAPSSLNMSMKKLPDCMATANYNCADLRLV